jgi:hypothetical protein
LHAHDGSWNGKQKQWIIDGTTVRASGADLAPGRYRQGSVTVI